jgi:hypothetical protein
VNGYNTTEWFQFDTTFIATGGEDKIFIGSFRPDADSYPVLINPSSASIGAYFYIDDVEVYVDDTVTSRAEDAPPTTAKIWFDAIARTIAVKGAAANASVQVYDAMGRLVSTGSGNMDVSGLPAGVYVVRVNDAQGNVLHVQKIAVGD